MIAHFKRSTLIVWLIMMSVLSCHAQERIRLTSGRTIKDARLYKEHENHITYEKRNSLHDLPKAELEYIETDSSYFKVSDGNMLIEVPKLETINKQAASDRQSARQSNRQDSEGYSQLMQGTKMGLEGIENEVDGSDSQPEEQEEVIYSEPFDDDGFHLPPASTLIKYGALALAYSTVGILIIALAI